MAGKLYIIVHPQDLRHALFNIPTDGARLLGIKAELDRIRRNEDYLEIMSDEDPSKLHRFMPPPNEVEVYLCGFYSYGCVVDQFDALKKAGYDVHVHGKALYPDNFVWRIRFVG